MDNEVLHCACAITANGSNPFLDGVCRDPGRKKAMAGTLGTLIYIYLSAELISSGFTILGRSLGSSKIFGYNTLGTGPCAGPLPLVIIHHLGLVPLKKYRGWGPQIQYWAQCWPWGKNRGLAAPYHPLQTPQVPGALNAFALFKLDFLCFWL